MTIKTIPIPSEYTRYASLLHAELLAPRSWAVTLSPLSVRLQLATPENEFVQSGMLHLDPTRRLIDLLNGRESIPLPEGSIRLKPVEITGTKISSADIRRGYLPLPPASVEIPGLPDPITTGLTATPGRREFTLHLQGRVTGARFAVRLTF